MHSGTIERVPLCLDNCFYDLSYCYIGLNSSLATKYKPYLRKQLVCSRIRWVSRRVTLMWGILKRKACICDPS